MTHPDLLLDRLQGVKPSGANRWLACCPAHEDSDPSLSIRHIPETGRILVNCFAGCEGADILTAVGLSLVDLYPPEQKSRERPITLSWADRASASPKARADKLSETLRRFVIHGTVRPDEARTMDTYASTYIRLVKAVVASGKQTDKDTPRMLSLCREWIQVRGSNHLSQRG